MANTEHVEQFEQIFSQITRPGAEKLLKFLQDSDFYEAPASTRYHNAKPGGLLEHSLNVYKLLKEKLEAPGQIWSDIREELGITDETIAVLGLLHDICKVKYYVLGTRNEKTYDEEKVKAAAPREIKHDANGDYIWEAVPTYRIEDKMPYGHGEKSVAMIDAFMRLTWPERYAIRWHMMFSEPQDNKGTLSTAVRMYPLILCLSECDMEATYMLEKEQA